MRSTEEFLSAMLERYNTSEAFSNESRPLVDAIFAEFEGEQRAGLLEFAESVFAQQAATEESIRASAQSLGAMAEALDRGVRSLIQAFDLLQSLKPCDTIVQLRPTPPSKWHIN